MFTSCPCLQVVLCQNVLYLDRIRGCPLFYLGAHFRTTSEENKADHFLCDYKASTSKIIWQQDEIRWQIRTAAVNIL